MMRIVRTAVMAGAMLGFVAASNTIAEAQQGTSKHKSARNSGKSADTSSTNRDAEASLDKARRALAEGKADTALQLANAVLISEKKDTRSTARALAIRGEAYLHQGRPAEAIADLESALWLKGGLEGRERELATNARSQAMQKGGIANAAPVIKAPLPAPAPPPVVPRAAPPPPVRSAAASPTTSAVPAPTWNNAVTVAPPPPAPVASAEPPVTTFKTTSARPETAAAPPPTASASQRASWSTAREPAPRPAQQDVAESKSASGGGITSFFSSLFGGGNSSAQSSETAPTTTAAVAATTPKPRTPAVSSSEPQRIAPEPRSSHSSTPRPAPVRAAAMIAPANPAPVSTPPNDGMYKLQLAAVRTKAEAQEMAEKARTEAAALVGSRTFEIVEDVYGNMGRFYRVRIGSFSEPTQALSVCASLRDRRMDCMVIDH